MLEIIMIPFLLSFENKRPKARELVLISVLCVLAITSREAFFMLLQFKPVLAIVPIIEKLERVKKYYYEKGVKNV